MIADDKRNYDSRYDITCYYNYKGSEYINIVSAFLI